MKEEAKRRESLISEISQLDAPDLDQGGILLYTIRHALAELDDDAAIQFRTSKDLYDSAVSACRKAVFMREIFLENNRNGYYEFSDGRRIKFFSEESTIKANGFPFIITMYPPNGEEKARLLKSNQAIRHIFYVSSGSFYQGRK